ncbi:MAG: acyloxyacyl hydrolase [Selenomonadaceae bacterium]|nr:acyloxyacyl hydrolase [Selenomonadaceae bacterium]
MKKNKILPLILCSAIFISNGAANAEELQEKNISDEKIVDVERNSNDVQNFSDAEKISNDVQKNSDVEKNSNDIQNFSSDEKNSNDVQKNSDVEKNSNDVQNFSSDENIFDGEKEFGVMSIGDKKDGKLYELQLEYLSGSAFTERRDMRNYNVHVFQKGKQVHAMSIYYGVTFTRATGYNIPRGIAYDSNGVGLGPAMMLRWEKKLSGKLYGSIDFSGSFMLYNKAHPYDGRAYGFLWRVGPRLTWKYDDTNSFSIGYNISHFSNAMRKHNPGYNTMGLSIGLSHQF